MCFSHLGGGRLLDPARMQIVGSPPRGPGQGGTPGWALESAFLHTVWTLQLHTSAALPLGRTAPLLIVTHGVHCP